MTHAKMAGVGKMYNRIIQIRLTEQEKKSIKNKMRIEGYHNLSAWIRQKLLSDARWMEQKIDVIYRFVVGQEEAKQKVLDEDC